MAMNMSFQRLVGGLKCAPLVVALLVLTSAEAPADILTFLHAGNGSGTLDGIPFSASDFLITAIGDTDDRHETSGGWHIHHTSASISIEGVADVDFVTPTSHFVNNTLQLVGFGHDDAGDLFNGPDDPLFSNWDMLSPIGPITGQGILLQWGIVGGVNTTGGILFFDDGTTDAIFSAVPEPGTLAIFVVGGMGLIVRRRTNARRARATPTATAWSIRSTPATSSPASAAPSAPVIPTATPPT